MNIANSKACDLILFGTLGDLAGRKLLPALYQLEKANLLAKDTRIIGVARENISTAVYVERVEEKLNKFLNAPIESGVWARLQERLHYLNIDLSQAIDYEKLTQVTDPAKRIPVSYFATPPSLFGQISQGLSMIGLSKAPARVVLEKPIGHDLASSIIINDEVSRYFNEDQIYRIDHYLGKETVLNLLVLRFANAIFSSNWDNTAIEHVQITVAEEVGVEGRWGYYDDAGQTRDMVQNHLLQILSLVAMEPPSNLDADSIRDEKLKVLKALRPIDISNVQENTVRGQYTRGYVKGKLVPGYLEEEDARSNSRTESFVALKVNIDNWRWAGVPFYLRTGKRMPKKHSEVAICFKSQPHNIFQNLYRHLTPNKLIIRLQPDEGVEIQIMNKVPGLEEQMQLQQSKLDLSFDKTFKSQRIADAYERLLLEVTLGNQYLFVRRDEVEQAWKWVDGILAAWKHYNESPLAYQAGTWGPVAAISLMARDGRNWDE
ncbi:glucose-6-phosphate dehydrogenase [Legionella jordanis]|uniref:Glucose-6-phosphate 1-dehydrogenase n=1 Tax=Legionella jordanis TaxID=456 RepID=A0A0W0VAB8_9GAMM|nr:glucose-6-phosphate dehydrogenase [Legionella jordanis]KTD17070.1 glucose-6-phosphate 1-dehydrogenase [Legionella jordanis]RMX03203.1 glucose-6-phosphate dehydrogenase [Legionella jordanis]RMX18657.1 glucose-6-phosphate dehydrogenase [Legionella jordanis]VEH12733.1 glucose-6-phosphate 1-dehydrogenase [Legionella jordanis]HAT8713118.1 glucose-6-phosphate dehydrogenase [Legionella jordanis]